MMDDLKVGFFDSGIGGKCVLDAFRKLCPEVKTVYFADTEHCPYGNRTVQEVRSFAAEITERFEAEGCSVIVVACNSATAAAIDFLRSRHPRIRFVGMEPAVKTASRESKTRIIAVLATKLTLNGGKFNGTKANIGEDVKIIEQVADEFVTEVERLGDGGLDALSSAETARLERIVARRLTPLLEAGADRIVLGCTHFPHLRKIMEKVCGDKAKIVDSSQAVAQRIKAVCEEVTANQEGFIACTPAGTEKAAEMFLGGKVGVIPTDTVYGLAAHPDRPRAVERLYTIKDRAMAKPVALLVDGMESAAKYIGEKAATFGAKYWPGALTVVARGEGVRVPAHEWTRALISRCGGALRVTSANMSGERPATDAPTSLATVGLKADFTVDDGVSRGGDSSTVVTFSDDGELRVLREGPVKFLVLASGSPRRAKILRDAGVDFTVRKSEAEEVSYDDDPERTVSENALVKGSKGNILSADTIVWLDNRIFGKPRDLEEAAEFLRILSGRTHTVFTGVAYNGEVKVVKSFVTFRRLSEEDIKGYIETVRPLDRAGAYDIDESGSRIVASYEGSYENIMGLPLEPLEEWGIIKK